MRGRVVHAQSHCDKRIASRITSGLRQRDCDSFSIAPGAAGFVWAFAAKLVCVAAAHAHPPAEGHCRSGRMFGSRPRPPAVAPPYRPRPYIGDRAGGVHMGHGGCVTPRAVPGCLRFLRRARETRIGRPATGATRQAPQRAPAPTRGRRAPAGPAGRHPATNATRTSGERPQN